MLNNLTPFLLHWAITALSLWVASHDQWGPVRKHIGVDRFGTPAGLCQCGGSAAADRADPAADAAHLGLFLLVINALMILLVSALVKGFRVSGFWTAFFASIFISLLTLVFAALAGGGDPSQSIQMPRSGVRL